MKILIFAGHSTNGYRGSGAIGSLNESNENRRLGKKVVEYLKAMGIDADFACVDIPKTTNYLKEQVSLANSMGRYDCMVQIHFNASNGNGKGTETYYISSKGKVFAERVHNKLKTLFRDRGVKQNNRLYWLKNTSCPSILIETCFCDNNDDAKIYNNNFNKVAQLIAEGLANKTYVAKPQEETKQEFKQYLARCTTNSLNCRKGAGTNYDIERQIDKGVVITIVEEKMNGNTKWGKSLSGYWVALKYMDFIKFV